MPDFYSEMQKAAAELLAPTASGGLGQGSIVLVRTVLGPPAQPWEASTETVTRETVQGAARGVSQKLVGTQYGGTVIVASDLQVICTPAEIKAGDRVEVDGKPMAILGVENIPAAGTTAAMRMIVR